MSASVGNVRRLSNICSDFGALFLVNMKQNNDVVEMYKSNYTVF